MGGQRGTTASCSPCALGHGRGEAVKAQWPRRGGQGGGSGCSCCRTGMPRVLLVHSCLPAAMSVTRATLRLLAAVHPQVRGAGGEMNPKGQHFVKTIKNSSNHLLNIINDILDVAALKVGSRARLISYSRFQAKGCLCNQGWFARSRLSEHMPDFRSYSGARHAPSTGGRNPSTHVSPRQLCSLLPHQPPPPGGQADHQARGVLAAQGGGPRGGHRGPAGQEGRGHRAGGGPANAAHHRGL